MEKTKYPHKHIPLKIYQKGPSIKYDSFLKRRSFDLEKEVEYCNANFLRLTESHEVILNGIPTDDLENEIQILELKLQQLYAKRTTIMEKGFISFTEDLIRERIFQNADIKAYTMIKNVLRSLILPLEDFNINSISKEF